MKHLVKGSNIPSQTDHMFSAPKVHYKPLMLEQSNRSRFDEDKESSTPQHPQNEHMIYGYDSEECYPSSSPPPLPPRLYLNDDDKILADQSPVGNLDYSESSCYPSSPPPPIPPRLYLDDDEVMNLDCNEEECLSSGLPPPIPPRLYLDDGEVLTAQLPPMDSDCSEDKRIRSSPPPPIPPRLYLHDEDFVANHLQSGNFGTASLSCLPVPPAHERDDEVNLRRCASDPPSAILARKVLGSQDYPCRRVSEGCLKSGLSRPVTMHSHFTNKKSWEKSTHSCSPPRLSSSAMPHVQVNFVDGSLPPPVPARTYLCEQLLLPPSTNHLSPFEAQTNLSNSRYGCSRCMLSRSMPSICNQSCFNDEVCTDQKLAENVIDRLPTLPRPSEEYGYSVDEFAPPIPPRTYLSESFNESTSRERLSYPKTLAVIDSSNPRPKSIHSINSVAGSRHLFKNDSTAAYPSQARLRQRHVQEELTKNSFRPHLPSPQALLTSDQEDVDIPQMDSYWCPLVANPCSFMYRTREGGNDLNHSLEELTSTPYAYAATPADNDQLSQARRRCNSFTVASYSLVGPSSPPALQTSLSSALTASCLEVGSLKCTSTKGGSHKSNLVSSQYSFLDVPPPLPKRKERRLFGFMRKKRAFFGRGAHQVQSDFALRNGSSKSAKSRSERKSTVPFGDRDLTEFSKQDLQVDDVEKQYDRLCHTTNVRHEKETFSNSLKETTYDHLQVRDKRNQYQLNGTSSKQSPAGNFTHKVEDKSVVMTIYAIADPFTERVHGLKLECSCNFGSSSAAQNCYDKVGLLRKANSSTPTCLEYASENEHAANAPCSALYDVIGKPSQENRGPGERRFSSCSKSRTWSASRNKQIPPLQPTGVHKNTNQSSPKKSSMV